MFDRPSLRRDHCRPDTPATFAEICCRDTGCTALMLHSCGSLTIIVALSQVKALKCMYVLASPMYETICRR